MILSFFTVNHHAHANIQDVWDIYPQNKFGVCTNIFWGGGKCWSIFHNTWDMERGGMIDQHNFPNTNLQ